MDIVSRMKLIPTENSHRMGVCLLYFLLLNLFCFICFCFIILKFDLPIHFLDQHSNHQLPKNIYKNTSFRSLAFSKNLIFLIFFPQHKPCSLLIRYTLKNLKVFIFLVIIFCLFTQVTKIDNDHWMWSKHVSK